jgi:hypothetical protein
VLGVTVAVAGRAAFGCFVLGGAVALAVYAFTFGH